MFFFFLKVCTLQFQDRTFSNNLNALNKKFFGRIFPPAFIRAAVACQLMGKIITRVLTRSCTAAIRRFWSRNTWLRWDNTIWRTPADRGTCERWRWAVPSAAGVAVSASTYSNTRLKNREWMKQKKQLYYSGSVYNVRITIFSAQNTSQLKKKKFLYLFACITIYTRTRSYIIKCTKLDEIGWTIFFKNYWVILLPPRKSNTEIKQS